MRTNFLLHYYYSRNCMFTWAFILSLVARFLACLFRPFLIEYILVVLSIYDIQQWQAGNDTNVLQYERRAYISKVNMYKYISIYTEQQFMHSILFRLYHLGLAVLVAVYSFRRNFGFFRMTRYYSFHVYLPFLCLSISLYRLFGPFVCHTNGMNRIEIR